MLQSAAWLPKTINRQPVCTLLSALIPNYGDVFAVTFFHHRDTEDTETRFLFAHRETAMGKKTEPSVKPSLLIET